jgi:hypothetical protein
MALALSSRNIRGKVLQVSCALFSHFLLVKTTFWHRKSLLGNAHCRLRTTATAVAIELAVAFAVEPQVSAAEVTVVVAVSAKRVIAAVQRK